MFFVFFLTLIIIGAISASSFIQKKLSQSKVAFEFVKPYEGWIGLVSMVLGFYWILRIIFNLGTMLKWLPVYTIIYLATLVVLTVLGLLLSKPLLKQLSGNNKKAADLVDQSTGKFEPLKEKLGIIALGLAMLNLVIKFT